MKAVGKTLKIVGLSVVIVLVILVVAFYLFSGYLLRVGIETAGTKALGVGVYVDDVDLSILGGTIEIDGLIVRNPPGYVHEDLLKLGRGKIQAKVGSLLADTLIIKELRLDGIDLVIEQKALSNNLRDVISSIGSKEKEKKEAEDEEAAEPAGKKLQISELEISNIRVKVKLLPMSGKEDTVTLNLATIKMSNLGTDSELDTGILVSKIFVAIADGVAKQGVGILPKEMVNRMKSALSQTLDLGKTTAEEGGKLIEKSKDVGEGIIEGFKGLFKPKKEE
jgi:hypothetical protein